MEYKFEIVEIDGEYCIEMIFPLANLILKPGESQTIRTRDADGNDIEYQTFTLIPSEGRQT